MADKIMTKDDFYKLMVDLNKTHEEMHMKLENLIVTPHSVNEIITEITENNEIFTEITENFVITHSEIINRTGLSKSFVADLGDGLVIDKTIPHEKRYALVECLRSAIYCGSYCGLTKKQFANLFETLVDTFSHIVKKGEILKLAGLARNDIADISNKKRTPSVKEQRNILMHFHSLCFDSLNNEIESLAEERELLEDLLGFGLCAGSKWFYDIYFRFCTDVEKEITELAALSEICPQDLRKIVTEDNYPYYPQKLHELSCIMLERSKDIIDSNKLNKSDLWTLKAWQDKYLFNEYQWENEEMEDQEKWRLKKVGDWFLTLPDPLKEIVYEFILMQFNVERYSSLYHYYIVGQNIGHYYLSHSHQSLILQLIQRFRKISADEKKAVLEYLHKNITIAFPIAPHDELNNDDMDMNAKNCFSESVVFSFFLSTLTKSNTLSERYKDVPGSDDDLERMVYMRKRYCRIWSMQYVNADYIKKALDFTSDEWQVAGYIEAAIVCGYPLRPIFDVLHAVPYDDGISMFL